MQRRIGLSLLAVALLAAIVWLAGTRRTETIFDRTGDFGRVRVIERADGLRYLVTGEGRARQSGIYPGRPRHLEFAYSRVAMVGIALAPPDGRMLFVGLGGGAMPMFTRAVLPRARIDAVEIDPIIVDVAQEYFGFRPDSLMRVHTGDGRAFIERAPPGTYDMIALDAFSDDEVPYSLTTRQFLTAVRESLAPRGVVVSNLWSRNPLFPAMVATYSAVFDEVRLLQVPDRSQCILLAGLGDRPLDEEAITAAARDLAARTDPGFDLPALVMEGYRPLPVTEAQVLEDR